MTRLEEHFSRKQWKGCCGKGCGKCEIAQAYIGEYGKKKGIEKLNEDRDVRRKAGKRGKKAKKKAAARK